LVRGSKGSSVTKLGTGCKLVDLTGKLIWEYAYPKVDGNRKSTQVPAMVQEHIDLVTCIRQGIPRVEAETTAITTMTAIMGRITAYTGKEVTWDEMLNSDLKLGPSTFVLGPSDIKAEIPVPGTDKKS